MTAPACSGCTGIGAAQPGSWTGWAGVLDGAGEVLTAPVLAEGVVLDPGGRRAERRGQPGRVVAVQGDGGDRAARAQHGHEQHDRDHPDAAGPLGQVVRRRPGFFRRGRAVVVMHAAVGTGRIPRFRAALPGAGRIGRNREPQVGRHGGGSGGPAVRRRAAGAAGSCLSAAGDGRASARSPVPSTRAAPAAGFRRRRRGLCGRRGGLGRGRGDRLRPGRPPWRAGPARGHRRRPAMKSANEPLL